jgi:chromosome segregation ATPase
MSQKKPSVPKSVAESLSRKLNEARADLATAQELNEKAHARVKFLEDEVAGYKDECGELEAENKRLVAERKTLAEKLGRRDTTIVQLGIRLAQYGDPASAEVEL